MAGPVRRRPSSASALAVDCVDQGELGWPQCRSAGSLHHTPAGLRATARAPAVAHICVHACSCSGGGCVVAALAAAAAAAVVVGITELRGPHGIQIITHKSEISLRFIGCTVIVFNIYDTPTPLRHRIPEGRAKSAMDAITDAPTRRTRELGAPGQAMH